MHKTMVSSKPDMSSKNQNFTLCLEAYKLEWNHSEFWCAWTLVMLCSWTLRPFAHWIIDLESSFFTILFHALLRFYSVSIVLFWRSYFCWWAKVKLIPCLYLENDTNCNAVYCFNGNIIKFSCISFYCQGCTCQTFFFLFIYLFH